MHRIRTVGATLVAAALLASSVLVPNSAHALDLMSWGDYLKQKVSGAAAGLQEKLAGLQQSGAEAKNVTIDVCFASDKTKWLNDPAVVKVWESATGHKVKLSFDQTGKKLLGSGQIMAEWDAGTRNCDLLSPDASVAGMSSSNWNPDSATLVASTMVVGIVHKAAVAVLEQHLGKPVADFTFNDLVSVSGKTWAELDPSDPQKGRWGPFVVKTTDPNASASSQVVIATLPYDVVNAWELSGMELNDPAVSSAVEQYRDNVDHTAQSTSGLTEQCMKAPTRCPVFFTYESKIDEVMKKYPAGSEVVYGLHVVQADQLVQVTAQDPAKEAAAISFVQHLLSDSAQQAAVKNGFRPATLIEVTGPVANRMSVMLGYVDPNVDVVSGALAIVSGN